MASPPEPQIHPLADRAMRDRIARSLFGTMAEPLSIGRFTVDCMLGSGGMGVVFRCHDPELGRFVAIKLLRHDASYERAELLAEARTLASLAHPNIVQIHEVGEHEGDPFIVMECVDGLPLDQWLADHERTLNARIGVCRQAIDGIAAAHGIGIVHRDLKPSNMLVGTDGRMRIADFGVSRSSLARSASSASSSTAAGTPAYMPPEVLAGSPADARSDQFSFCMVAYEVIFGCRAFDFDDLLGMAERPDVPPRPRRATKDGPAWLKRILLRGLDPSPARRYPDMAALGRAIEAAPRHRRLVGLGLAFVLVAGVGASWGAARPECAAQRTSADAVWNSQRRASLFDRAATEAAFAAPAIERTARALDAHIDDWRHLAEQSCLATRVEHRKSEPWLMDIEACLERDIYRVDMMVDALLDGSSTTLAATDRMLVALGHPSACVHDDAGVAVTGAAAQAADDLRSRGDMALASGQVAQARAFLDRALESAEAAADPTRTAAVRSSIAALARSSGDAATARSELLDAIKLAEGARADDLAAAGWCALVELAALELERPDLASAWLDRSEAAVMRLGSPTSARACHETATGHLRWLEGDFVRSADAYQRAIDFLQGAPETGPLRLEQARRALANVLADMGDMAAAIETYESLLEDRRRRLGEAHPEVGVVEFDLAFALARADDVRSARAQAESAATKFRDAFGSSSSRYAQALSRIAELDLEIGETETAIEHLESAFAILDASDAEQADRRRTLTVLGNALIQAGRFERALEVELELAASLPASALRTRAEVEVDIGELQCRLQQCEQAWRHYEWALRHVEAGDWLGLYALNGLAKVELMRGEPESAIARFREVLRGADASSGEALAELRAEARWYLARALLDTARDPAEALELIELARTFYQSVDDATALAELQQLATRSNEQRRPPTVAE